MDGIGDTQRILEMQFMQSFSTGNFIIDTVIKGFIITITGKGMIWTLLWYIGSTKVPP